MNVCAIHFIFVLQSAKTLPRFCEDIIRNIFAHFSHCQTQTCIHNISCPSWFETKILTQNIWWLALSLTQLEQWDALRQMKNWSVSLIVQDLNYPYYIWTFLKFILSVLLEGEAYNHSAHFNSFTMFKATIQYFPRT